MANNPGLKLIVLTAPGGRLDTLAQTLESMDPTAEMCRLSDAAVVFFTPLTPHDIRDRLKPHLQARESVFVVAFEQWSGAGPGVDSGWLLWRGH